MWARVRVGSKRRIGRLHGVCVCVWARVRVGSKGSAWEGSCEGRSRVQEPASTAGRSQRRNVQKARSSVRALERSSVGAFPTSSGGWSSSRNRYHNGYQPQRTVDDRAATNIVGGPIDGLGWRGCPRLFLVRIRPQEVAHRAIELRFAHTVAREWWWWWWWGAVWCCRMRCGGA